MQAQDFETYAEIKPFNFAVAPTWRAVADEVISRLDRDLENIKVLDYGCGDGKYYPFFVERGLPASNIHGLEVSSKRLERCREIGWENTRLLEPGRPLPFAEESFDLINCMEVIEHIPALDGERAIAELRRLLRPGGFLMISTPNYPIKRFYDIYDAFFLRDWRRLRDDPTHVTMFNEKKLRVLLERNFAGVERRDFKPGFLYKRLGTSWSLHKLFFLCRA